MGHEQDRLASSQHHDERIAFLERSLARDQSALREKVEEIERLEQALDELTSSVSWRLAKTIGGVGRLVAPPATRRRRALRFVFQSLRAIPKNHRASAKSPRQTQPAIESSTSPGSVPNEPFDLNRSRVGATSHRNFNPVPATGPPNFIHCPRPESAVCGRVLIIDHRLPTPDRDAGSLRMMEIIHEFLRRKLHVTFLPDNMSVFEPYLEDLKKIRIEVVHPPEYLTAADYLEQHGRDLNLVVIARAEVADRHIPTVRRFAPKPGSCSTPLTSTSCERGAKPG